MSQFMIVKPRFHHPSEFWDWKKDWSSYYKQFSKEIRQQKQRVKKLQRGEHYAGTEQRKLHYMRKNGQLLMKLLEEGIEERDKRQRSMDELAEHMKQYPLNIPKAKEVIFHFNKGHIFNPELPMWVVKAKGKTYYVHHVQSTAYWNTKETPDHPVTKGSIKLKNVSVNITEDATAQIEQI